MTSVGTVISYPIPAYANVPIEAQFYQPSRFIISNISLGSTTTVTTSVDHNYVVGQLVRLLIPASFGCYQLNETQGYVLSIPTTTSVVVSIDSLRNVDPYISSTASTKAQILAIGDINSGQTNTNGIVSNITYIPGSFINISPE